MSQHAEQIDLSTAGAAAREPQAANAADPHIYGLFPAQVRGVDSSGELFHTQTLLDNFGAAEFELRLSRRVESGEQLLVVADIHDATVALHGTVLRADSQADGSYRLTVVVTHHRFL
jgi:hypothetical protein